MNTVCSLLENLADRDNYEIEEAASKESPTHAENLDSNFIVVLKQSIFAMFK